MWDQLDTKLRQEQADYDQWCAEWAEEAADLFTPLMAMGSKMSSGWSSVPWIFLPLPKPDGSWTYMPKASTRKDGTKQVWLNPAHQDLWSAGWYTAEDLRGWARGEGPIWPFCVALPPQEHPFWAEVRASVPKPNRSSPFGMGLFSTSFHANLASAGEWQAVEGIGIKLSDQIIAEREAHGDYTGPDDVRSRVHGIGPKLHLRIKRATYYTPAEWPEFPFDHRMEEAKKVGYSVYLDGWGFWHYAQKKWGFRVAYDYRDRGARHSLFRSEIAKAQEGGLPTLARVSDLDLFLKQVEAWNTANPEHPVDFHLYGRGMKHLTDYLKANG